MKRIAFVFLALVCCVGLWLLPVQAATQWIRESIKVGDPAGTSFTDIDSSGNIDTDGTIEAGSADTVLTNADGTIILGAVEQDGATGGQVIKWNATTGMWEPANDVTTGTLGEGDVTTSHILDGTISTVDIGNNEVTDAKVVDALTISGGTVDNSVIGGSTAAAGSFTTLAASGNTTLTGDLAVNGGDVTIGNEALSDYGPGVAFDGTIKAAGSIISEGTYAQIQGKGVVLDFDQQFGDTINDDINFRFGRNTDVGTGTAYTRFYIADNSNDPTLTIDHGTGSIVADGTLTAGSGSEVLTNADGTINLEALEQDGATTGEVLKWDGTDWAPGTDSEGTGGGTADGERTIVLTAAGGTPQSTNGCAEPAVNTDDTIEYWALDFDATADEYAIWSFVLPEDYDENAMGVEFVYRAGNSSGSDKTVQWQIEAVALDDLGVLATASYGTSQSVNDTVGMGYTGNTIFQVTTSTALTIGGTPLPGDMCVVRVMRDVSADDLGADAGIVSVKLTY